MLAGRRTGFAGSRAEPAEAPVGEASVAETTQEASIDAPESERSAESPTDGADFHDADSNEPDYEVDDAYSADVSDASSDETSDDGGGFLGCRSRRKRGASFH